jgi:EmrB/QacA subfamily drug resistance transporter
VNQQHSTATPASADTSHASSHPGGTSRNDNRWLALAVICIGTMMAFINVSSTIGALSSMQADLHSSPTEIVWITSTYSLVVASLILAFGTLSDILGRRRIFAVGALFFVAGSLIAFAAHDTGVLIAGQAVIGIGGAMVLPSGLSIVSHIFTDPRQRTEAISIWAGSSGLGVAIGPLAAGALLETASWNLIFLINVGLGIAAFVGALVLVPDSRHPDRRLDVVGVLLGTITVATLTFAIIEGKTLGYTSDRILTAYALTAIALVAFVIYEARHPDPMMDVRLFRSGSFSAVMGVAATAMFGFTGTALITVLYLQHVQSLTPLEAGVRSLTMFVPFILLSALAGKLVHKTGFKVMLTAGLLVLGSGILALLWTANTTSFTHVWPGLVIVGIGSGLLVAPSTAAAVISVHPTQAGMASSAVNMFRQLGNVLGASVLGTIITSQFASNLTDNLTAGGLPQATADQITAGAQHGEEAAGLPAQVADLVTSAVGNAFTDAYHSAALVAGIVVLVVAIPTVFLVRHRPAR